MDVSIVTVCLNAEKRLSKTIESVLSQTMLPKEYIIIDGESTDNTINIAKSYCEKFRTKRINYQIFSGKDGGIYSAMNLGIKKCTGDVVAILNSDDWYETNALERMTKYIQESDVDIAHSDINLYDKSGNDFEKRYKSSDNKSHLFWRGMTLNHPTFFVKRNVYERLLYDESFKLISDYLFVLESRKLGFKYGYVNEALVNMSSGGFSSLLKIRIIEGHRARIKAGYPRIQVYLSSLYRISISITSIFIRQTGIRKILNLIYRDNN